MNTETQTFLAEAAATGRIKSMIDSVIVGLGKGVKRSSAERRATWAAIAEEATRCVEGIPAATKARAPKAAKTPATQGEIKIAQTGQL